ncbi:unnamed protein product [Porites evermanni]|uniref:Reverse transcriptase domain-containing protein n=1 Tax=Porites evermanni TaxID=104178 RepID=A0ABN8SN22_9CNID|nr:unnamed protein product [Porites evermanni]
MYMIPLTKILRKAKAGYTLDDIKVNHLLFMDDLKLFAKNRDIAMEVGLKKCEVTVFKRAKLRKTAG